MNLPDDFIFSQSSLQDYVDCPRRFQLRYLMRQRFPAPVVDDMLEFERKMAQGEHFHHLVHQHLVGIPAELLTRRLEDVDVRRWFETYLKAGLVGVPEVRRPEVSLTVPLGEYALMAKFDLVALGERALIIDWKTGQHVPKTETLARRLQTIVYRYVLAKGGAQFNHNAPIRPDRIEMVYWYADKNGENRKLPYSIEQFQADEEYLLKLVDDINTRAEFPLTEDVRRCRFCVYRSLNDRGTQAGSVAEWNEDDAVTDVDDFELDLEQIGEIEF
jgi:predicted RecB family nuclease